jgi:hypothetical protein
MVNGNIRVKHNDGKDVIVETQASRVESGEDKKEGNEPGGLQGWKAFISESKVEEDDNVVSVLPGPLARAVSLQVPAKCSLKLACSQAGEIVVENVEGEIEASGINGSVKLLDVSGVALAHTINGHVKVTFQRILPNKAMSFSTLNGDIDVTLPATTKATVKLETLNGSIHSDFEILPDGGHRQSKVTQTVKGGTPFVWTTEKFRSGTINGGGPEFRFRAFNGTIHLRKK